MKVASPAFGEDRILIEAQPRVIDQTVGPVIMGTTDDRSIAIFTSLVARLARGEAAAAMNVS